MIVQAMKPGLIVSASQHATAALDELIAYCGWPVLVAATPRQLRREFLLRTASVSLFWLDESRDLDAVLELLRWLRGYRPAVKRFVLAYRPDREVERAVRRSNVQFFAAVDRDLRNLLAGPSFEWLTAADASPPVTAPLRLELLTGADRSADRGTTFCNQQD
jgi:signal transduction histidine kinase